MPCNTDACGACGACSACGYAAQLLLSQPELQILEQLRICPFLPVARRADTMEPHCREEGMPPETTLALQLLERKGLIRLDYDRPLGNCDYSAYSGLPVRGYMSLTARGQDVLDTLEIQGYITEEQESGY